jgi:hypothetical protein
LADERSSAAAVRQEPMKQGRSKEIPKSKAKPVMNLAKYTRKQPSFSLTTINTTIDYLY